MVGMVDFGIVKPELAGSFGAGMQASQENRMRTEEAQLKLDQLKQDREAMLQFQQQLKAAGKDPDLNKLFDAMIATGHPDYAMKGVEGKRRLKAQEEFAKLQGADMGGAPETAPVAAPAAAPVQSVMRAAPAPASMNALGSGTFGMGAEPTNALAAQAAAPVAATPAPAPVNALAAQPNAGQALQIQKRINDLMRFASSNPEMATQAMQQARILQDQLELFSRRSQNEPADMAMMRQLGFPLTKEGFQAYQDSKRQDRLLTPAELQQKLQIAAASRAPGTTVTMVSEKAEQGARGKMLVDQYSDISKSAGLAVKTLPSIEANLSALNKGLDTGFGTDAKAAGARILGALGVKDAEKFATDTQTFQSNAMSALMQKQLEQKGPQTESDAARLEQIGAQLGKTKDANRFILDTAKEQLRRDVDQRNFYDRWYETRQTYNGAENAWFAGEGGKSLFDRPALKKYLTPTTAASQIPGQGPAAPAARTVVRTGTLNGRRVIQYSDGSTEYGN